MVETFILRCPLILAGSSKTVTAIRTLMSVTKPMHPISVFRITDRVKEPVRFTHWTNQTAGNDDNAAYEQQSPSAGYRPGIDRNYLSDGHIKDKYHGARCCSPESWPESSAVLFE